MWQGQTKQLVPFMATTDGHYGFVDLHDISAIIPSLDNTTSYIYLKSQPDHVLKTYESTQGIIDKIIE